MTTTRQSGPDVPVDQELVLDLPDLDVQLLSVVGGKAAHLGELIDAGLAVPAGFCITTEAYRQVAEVAELDGILDVLDTAACEAAACDTGALAKVAGQVRAALLAAPTPAVVEAAIKCGYGELGEDVPVAVRSSATAEDLPWASFAGQQDTYLNVVGIDAVLDAVHRCWASLWTDRAINYRRTNGIDHRAVRLAVVVQEMVDAQVAGVLFTADPVTGCRQHTVIDASPGLGEAVVSGSVNPDHFVIDAGGVIVERRLGDKRVAVRPRPGGGTERLAQPADAGQSCLRDAQLRELAALGKRVQEHFGAPQDIEWALDHAETVWLTQARPITTLYPLPTHSSADSLRVYLCMSLAQGLTRPITPMGIAVMRLVASCASEVVFGAVVQDPIAGPPALVEAGQRVFVDITPVLHSQVGRTLVPRVLDVMEARSAVVLRRLFDDPRLAMRTASWQPFLRRVLTLAVRFKIPLQIIQALVRPDAARRRVARVGSRLRATLTVPMGMTGAQRLDHVQRLLSTAVIPVMPRVVPVAGTGFLAQAVAVKLAAADLEPHEMDEVRRGLPHNVTTEMDLELWALATRLRADAAATAALREATPAVLAHRFSVGELPAVLQRGLEKFLKRYGHRAIAEIDLGMPRWSDDPSYVLGVLANYLRRDDRALPPDAQFAQGGAAAEATAVAVARRVRRRSRLRAAGVRFTLGRVRQLVGMRETHKDYLVRILAHAREQLRAVGAEIATAGRLAEPDDVFFLDLAQARAALAGADFRAVVAQRRETYTRELRRRNIPRIMLSDGTVPENTVPQAEALAVSATEPTAGQLIGTPASAGTVTGPARVVLDPVGAQLEPGEILVTPSTDPGWTPLFLTAGGLIMEMGGANSHGAVVAREYGIPAVVGVTNATLQISTGQQLTVHGATGLIAVE